MYEKTSLKAINRIIESMPGMSEVERYNAFATIKVLGAELDENAATHNLPTGSIRMILTDLYEAARALAYLSDRGDRDDSYYVSEAYAAVNKLSRPMYFGEVEEG